MKVTWYGHSCFMLEQDGYKILLDPYYPDKVPGLRLPALAAHEVLCSHQHADHGAAELVYWMRNPTTYRLSVGGTFCLVRT